MIQESIVLYEEFKPKNLPVVVQPVISESRYTTYQQNFKRMFNLSEVTSAIEQLNTKGFRIGKYFQYNGEQIKYLIRRYETRPAFIDAVRGDAGVLIAQKVGSVVEVVFSPASLEDAFICD